MQSDVGLTERVQHQVSQTAGPQNVPITLHSTLVQLPASASQQWRKYCIIVHSARVAVVQPDGCGDTRLDLVQNEPHLEVLKQHDAGRLGGSRCFSGILGQGVHVFWLRYFTNVGGAGRGLAGKNGDGPNCVNAGVCWECACGVVVGAGV